MKYIDELIERRKHLEPIKYDIVRAFEIIRDCYKKGKKVLICGNGGSASDSAHIVGELMKGFKKKRTISSDVEDKLYKTIEDYFDKNGNINVKKKMDEMKESLEQGLPTIDLTAFTSLNSAFANDKNWDYAYANGVLGFGDIDDVLIAITTSGNSKNVVNSSLVAKAKGIKVISFTGKDGGNIKDIADVNIIAPSDETFIIQEDHIAIYHAICLDIEEEFF